MSLQEEQLSECHLCSCWSSQGSADLSSAAAPAFPSAASHLLHRALQENSGSSAGRRELKHSSLAWALISFFWGVIGEEGLERRRREECGSVVEPREVNDSLGTSESSGVQP